MGVDDRGPYASWHLYGDGGEWLKDNVNDGIFFFGSLMDPYNMGNIRLEAGANSASGFSLSFTRLDEGGGGLAPTHIHWGVPNVTPDGAVNGCTHCNISALVQLDAAPGSVPFSIVVTLHRLFSTMPMPMNEAPLGPDDPYFIQLVNRTDFFTFRWDGFSYSVWSGNQASPNYGGVKLSNDNFYRIFGEVTQVPEGLPQTAVEAYAFFEWKLSLFDLSDHDPQIVVGPMSGSLTITDFAYNLYCGNPKPAMSDGGGE